MNFLFLSVLSVSLTAQAGGDNVGNGGDACEKRFDSIRRDLASWISKGGSQFLNLPEGLPLQIYNKKMLEQIEKASFSCTSATLKIGTTEKTCKNLISENDESQILCNQRRFLDTADSEQYELVHHEYAGLAGFEKNIGEQSVYTPLSEQITGYLDARTELRLAIRPDLQPCPNLTGDYICNGQHTTIKSVIYDGGFVFKVDDKIYYADKKKRESFERLADGYSTPVSRASVAWCEGRVLHATITTTHAKNGDFWNRGDLATEEFVQLSRDPFGDVKISGYFRSSLLGTLPIGRHCLRVPSSTHKEEK